MRSCFVFSRCSGSDGRKEEFPAGEATFGRTQSNERRRLNQHLQGKLFMMARIFALSALSVFVCASPAYAYIDPGAGGFFLQLLFAGIGGALVVIKIYWKRIVKIFSSRGRRR